MNLFKTHKLLIVIFLFALFIRLYNLNTFPLGFHVDEAKVAWQSYSILKTGRDDHGNFLSLYYNSFGDYRPTGIFYITIPSLVVFGKTIWGVRLPSALAGTLSVIPMYYIANQILKKKTGIWATLLFAITPWAVTTSRATSEVVISCFLILSALALLTKRPRLSFILIAVSFFFYHSARIVGPPLVFVWIIYFWKKIKEKKTVLIGLVITSLLALFLVLSPTGLARYNQVKLAKPTIRSVIVNYTSYFDPNFLIGDISKPFRYKTLDNGIISIPIFILFLLGIYLIIKENKNKILILLMAIGPIPASLTLEDSPNLHRSLFMLPFLIIIAAIGLEHLWQKHKLLFKIFVICIILSFISFLFNYFNLNTNFAYQYRDPQMLELASYIYQNKNNYDLVYVTNDPDSPYPWYYFFNNYNPQEVNKALEKQNDGRWQYENLIWDNNRCPRGKAFENAVKNKKIKKILVVDNGMCTTDPIKGHLEAKIIKEFSYKDQINYRLWEYKPTRN